MTSPGIMLKWSSKPKDHNTIRVRENQRRHRARRKAYIEDLERQLGEARAQLSSALAANAQLQSELTELRRLYATRPCTCAEGHATERRTSNMSPEPHVREDELASSLAGDSVDISQPGECCSVSSSESQVAPSSQPLSRSCDNSSSPEPPPSEVLDSSDSDRVTERKSPPLPLDRSTSTSIFFEAASRFPQPAPGESTIPCIVADAIIADQSCNRLDLRALSDRLGPGFRCSTVPEEGCRVVSTSIFSVLDMLNPL